MCYIIKHYKCPIYKTVKCKIFKVCSIGNVKLESVIFNHDQLKKMISLYKVKNPIFTECRTVKNIEILNNEIN